MTTSIDTLRKLKTRTPSHIALCALLALGGCQHFNLPKKPDSQPPQSTQEINLENSTLNNRIERGPKTVPYAPPHSGNATTRFADSPSQIGSVPTLGDPTATRDTVEVDTRAPVSKVKTIDAYVDPLPVPQFIDVVYGKMLKVPYVTGPEVAQMTESVQLRSSGKIKSAEFQTLVADALETYGVKVVPQNGTYQIQKDSALRARIPHFIKSRARQRTRGDLRPVIQFVEMRALSAGSMVGFLREAFGFGASAKLTATADPQANYVTLSGLPENVDAALEIIQQLDDLRYSGSEVHRIEPLYWEASELATELTRALQTEGWQVSLNVQQSKTISLLPIEYSNDIFVFARTQQAHRRVKAWVKELDRPVQGGDSEQIFVYQVKNVDAEILAETANSVISGPNQSVFSDSSDQGISGINAPTADSTSPSGANSLFTVDPIGNRIVFTGTTNEYTKLRALLEQLDTPAPEVLIEVQIAEVTLTDDSNFGVEFFIEDLGGESVQATANSGGLGLGSSGLTVDLLSGNVDATINAFANNRRVKVLSTPTLTARSGSAAEIQIGQDIPVITSQRAANNQNGGGSTDILQQIDYRETGVLMAIEPIVFSDGRIDLTISQEVSSVLGTSNSSISSPTISNRSLTTQLSLEDGQTAIMGGLIQENTVRDEDGIPFLKDIPILGQAFSVEAHNVTRTELVILITAYVLRGQTDRSRFVNSARDRVDNLIKDESRLVTLKPKNF